MDPGPRPTNAEMAQLVELLEERGLVEVYTDEQGRETSTRALVVPSGLLHHEHVQTHR